MPIIPTLSKVRKNLTKEENDIIDKFLNEMSEHNGISSSRVVDNIKSEHFLSPAYMKKICATIIDNFGTKSIIEIESELVNLFRKKLKRKGGKIQIPNPKYVGTVIPRESFEKVCNLSPNKKYFGGSTTAIKRFIDTLIYRKFVPKRYENVILKVPNRIIWLTFYEEEKKKPFDFCKFFNKPEILCHLGLGDSDRFEGDVIGFILDMELIDSKMYSFYRPTICDAELYEFFAPTKDELRFGKTKPLDNGFFYNNKNEYKAVSCNEMIENSEYLPIKAFNSCFLLK